MITPAYHYAGEYTEQRASGTAARLPIKTVHITNPYDHSLTEIDAQSYDGKSVVEIGVANVSYKLGPSLFVSWWQGGKLRNLTWYGDPHATSGMFSLRYTAGKWVAVYDGKVLERIAGSHWRGQFTRAEAEQAFAEAQGPVKFVTGTVRDFRAYGHALVGKGTGTLYGPVVRSGAGAFRIY